MTLGSGRAPVALSAKQLSCARQGSWPKYRRGDQPKGNGYKFHAEREDRDAGKTPRLAGEQHAQDHRVESNRKGRVLKRPNLFEPGMAGQLEDMSVED